MDLFSPLTIRNVTLRNRIAVSPMCQYSCENGMASNWHLVHLGSRAVGGAGLVMVEATAVSPDGRISPGDMGIWSDAHTETLKPIAAFIKEQGAVPAMQLAHAGRKASFPAPWIKPGAQLPLENGGWATVAPSPIPFNEADRTPGEMSLDEIAKLIENFRLATKRALAAGFEILELHGAHGYLLNEFLSPLTNHRSDEYGDRHRLAKELVQAARSEWPTYLPLFLRISASDWAEGGWTVEDSVQLAKAVQPLGVDLMDCSSGGTVPQAKIPVGPGFQVPFAEQIKREAGILTGAVGLITEPHQADKIITSGQADLVLMAREFLRDPYWPLHAAKLLGASQKPPVQYERAF